MSTLGQRLYGILGGVLVTALLLAFLLAGSFSGSVPEKTQVHGAVRLSNYQEETVREEEMYATSDTPQVEPMEQVTAPSEMNLDAPALEMDMPSMDMEMSPQVAGTIPIAGLSEIAAPSAHVAPSGGALTLGEVDELPRALYAPPPLYPMDAKAKDREYEVKVRIILRKDGTVGKVEPLYETPESAPFHAAAVEAIKHWRFIPCKKGGKAVQCMADQPVTFSLSQ